MPTRDTEALTSGLAKHPANPKASARMGVRRFPPGVAALLDPRLTRSAVMDAVISRGVEQVARTAAMITHSDGKIAIRPLTEGAPTPADLRGLWPIRRIGGHREAPNRVGVHVRWQDGYRILLETESRLEDAHLRNLDFNHGVEWLLTQPLILRWTIDDRFAWRVPDILAFDSQGAFVADVKPESAQSDYARQMFELTRASLTRVGIGYRVLGALPEQQKENLRTIAFARWPNPALADELLEARNSRRSTLGGVIDSAGGGGAGEWVAMHLLSKELSADLNRPLTKATPVKWPPL